MTNQAKPLIAAKALSVAFRKHEPILRDVDFGIGKGEFVSLLGPSGCGKSTLLRLIAGLIEPTGGSIEVDGKPPVVARRSNQNVGIVFQDPVLLPWRTVERNICLPGELTGTPTKSISDLLRLVGLEPTDANKRPSELSGGMRMRVSLARALVTQPDLFLLDEPFAALDDVLRQQLNEELLRIREQQKCTTVFVTHNVSEAVFLSQRILVLSSGPANIATQIEVPFDYPRESSLKGTPEFAALVQQVSEQLRGAATCAG
ncbi:MAG: ABC transporter ATP-binding protein [Planctomycetaceae bacterium]